MKTRLFLLAFTAFFLVIFNQLNAQTTGLSLSLTKTDGKIFSINDAGKHMINFEISGISSPKQAENLMKFISNYRGVEDFKLEPIAGKSTWKGEGVFYEYSDVAYFKNLFKLMKVTEIIQDNVKTSIDNL